MDCPVCFRPWDLQDVRPKALPCLHSLCRSCLARLNDMRCPTCRKAFTEPVSDNFALVACLEAFNLERPRVTWWCMDCQRTASAECVDEHDVRRPKAALRRGLQDWMPAAIQDLQGLQDGLQGLQDSAALTALLLLRGVPATCKVSLRQDDGDAFGAGWRVDGQGHSEDSLLRTLFVALAASGRLQQEPSEVQQEAAPAEQQPAGQRIGELSLRGLNSADPNVRAETLGRVRQYGVRLTMPVYCNTDPAALDVLRSAAPTLEELHVFNPREEHLVVVHHMPRLRRMVLFSNCQGMHAQPPLLPALPQPSSLQWLQLTGLPRATTVSLLQAHAASLDVLWLHVGAFLGGEWDLQCSDLDALLGQCGLRLSGLVLFRYHGIDNDAACRAQVAAARSVLPGCTVKCKDCDRVRDRDEY